VIDIVGILNGENDYTKARNYWKYFKTKLKKENNELVSITTLWKLRTPGGKMRLTDTLDSSDVTSLAKHFPNNKAMKFLDWFLYSDNSFDAEKAPEKMRRLEQNQQKRLSECNGSKCGKQFETEKSAKKCPDR
jgi:cell filamentation protein